MQSGDLKRDFKCIDCVDACDAFDVDPEEAVFVEKRDCIGDRSDLQSLDRRPCPTEDFNARASLRGAPSGAFDAGFPSGIAAL
jgi:hypothetical protein